MPHCDFDWVLRGREIVSRRGKHANTPFNKGDDAGLLDDEMPSETRRMLDQDRSYPVVLDPIQQS